MNRCEHVRPAAPADGRHKCHWPGCTVAVPPAMWGCKAHWFKLPLAIRQRIWRAYRAGQEISKTPSAEYVAAARAAVDWIDANAAPVGKGALL